MILEIEGLPADAVVLVNDTPVAIWSASHGQGRLRQVLDPKDDHVSGGQNELKLSLLTPLEKKTGLSSQVKLYQTKEAVTSRGQWQFAHWTRPDDEAFDSLPQSGLDRPAWFRCHFNAKPRAARPLWFEPRGLTKGQLYLNGHNVGRYFAATRDGKAVGPQKHHYLPAPWLNAKEANELLIFDEHGKLPTSARVVYGDG